MPARGSVRITTPGSVIASNTSERVPGSSPASSSTATASASARSRTSGTSTVVGRTATMMTTVSPGRSGVPGAGSWESTDPGSASSDSCDWMSSTKPFSSAMDCASSWVRPSSSGAGSSVGTGVGLGDGSGPSETR